MKITKKKSKFYHLFLGLYCLYSGNTPHDTSTLALKVFSAGKRYFLEKRRRTLGRGAEEMKGVSCSVMLLTGDAVIYSESQKNKCVLGRRRRQDEKERFIWLVRRWWKEGGSSTFHISSGPGSRQTEGRFWNIWRRCGGEDEAGAEETRNCPLPDHQRERASHVHLRTDPDRILVAGLTQRPSVIKLQGTW